MAQYFCCVAGRVAGIVSVVRFDDRAETAEVVSQLAVGAKPMPIISEKSGRLCVAAGEDPVHFSTLELGRGGELSLVDSVPCPFPPTYMSFSPDRRLLAAVSYHQSRLAVVPVDDDGTVDGDAWQVQDTGRQPHCIVFSPDGRFAYHSELAEDRIVGHRVEGSELVQDPALGVAFPAGDGPRHLAIDASGTHVYVIEELGGHLAHLTRSAETGELTMVEQVDYFDEDDHLRKGVFVPPDREPTVDEQEARMWGADIVLDPARRWIVTSERRSSTLTLQSLAPDGSFGARLQHVPTEIQPRGMGLVGAYHVVVGAEKGETATFYRVGHELTEVATVKGLGGPIWMATVSA